MSLVWKLQIDYGKNLTHVTEDVTNKGRVWSTFVSDEIRSIQMLLPPSPVTRMKNGVIHLEGFEMFNFQVEASWEMATNIGRMMSLWFRGKHPGKAVSENIRVSFNNDGDYVVDKHYLEFGKEWDGTPVSGWKGGIPIKNPFSGLFIVK